MNINLSVLVAVIFGCTSLLFASPEEEISLREKLLSSGATMALLHMDGLDDQRDTLLLVKLPDLEIFPETFNTLADGIADVCQGQVVKYRKQKDGLEISTFSDGTKVIISDDFTAKVTSESCTVVSTRKSILIVLVQRGNHLFAQYFFPYKKE